MDGRDTPPHSGVDFLAQLLKAMREYGVGKIASVSGRYYAMDRDNRWERIERAYRAMVHGYALHQAMSAVAEVRASYERGITDEFVEPIVITEQVRHGQSAVPVGLIRDDDAVIFFNFRADRARQMSRALAEPGFDKIADSQRPKNLFFVGMTQYDKTFSWMRFLLSQEKLEHILANVFAEMNFKNLRVAETEKYAHVTYFFNGGVEKPFPGEDRILVPSPKVPTYDLKPEMSAAGIADAVTNAIRKGDFDAIIMNFANADMVGHSGKLEPAIKAVETVDACLGRIWQSMKDAGDTAWIITADHGNAETMVDPATGGPHTYHTTNPVPLILVSNDANVNLQSDGSLRDISPTLLGVLGIQEPVEMTGRDLRAPQRK
jgi:2,3-bisphosphoglycerate-independent phosphoglycerate mutase